MRCVVVPLKQYDDDDDDEMTTEAEATSGSPSSGKSSNCDIGNDDSRRRKKLKSKVNNTETMTLIYPLLYQVGVRQPSRSGHTCRYLHVRQVGCQSTVDGPECTMTSVR